MRMQSWKVVRGSGRSVAMVTALPTQTFCHWPLPAEPDFMIASTSQLVL
jgi:hypothetical protein